MEVVQFLVFHQMMSDVFSYFSHLLLHSSAEWMTSPYLGLWDLGTSVEFWLLLAHKVHKEESHQWTVLANKRRKYIIKTCLLRQQCTHNLHNALSKLTMINVKAHYHKAYMVIYFLQVVSNAANIVTLRNKGQIIHLAETQRRGRSIRW